MNPHNTVTNSLRCAITVRKLWKPIDGIVFMLCRFYFGVLTFYFRILSYLFMCSV